MEHTINALATYIPAELNITVMLKFVVIFAFLSVFAGLLGRVIFGKLSSLNHALSAAMAIFFIYVLTIVLYSVNIAPIAKYLTPLPFVSFAEDKLYIFSFGSSDFNSICSQVLSMVILSFIVNVLEFVIPEPKNVFLWFLLRLVTVIGSFVLFFVAGTLLETYLPDATAQYAPIILLIFLLVMLLVGVFQFLMGAILTKANPIVGGIYAFFSNVVGKQFTKSVVTTIVFCILIFLLEFFGYAVITISAAALTAYIPLILALLALWYLMGHVL